jgi:hypothetical protein
MTLVSILEEYELESIVGCQPWENHPYDLVSWWDMLEFSAREVFWAAHILQSIKIDCYMGSVPDGQECIFAFSHDLGDGTKTKAIAALVHVEDIFRGLGMEITADTAREIITALEKESPRRNLQWLIDQIDNLRKLSEKEMKGKAFFYVPPERAKFFPRMSDQHIFGNAVATAFPSAAYDIAESGICLALARGTPSVFHLMRVLEIGLTALGDKFNVSLAHANWAPAIEQIESKIREMHKDPAWKALPDCKEQQEFYAQAAVHFGVLKDAWRNYTMHRRGFYTEEQAERIFENTKDFMQKLSKKLSERIPE